MPTLNWIGKDKVLNHHLEVPYRVLEKKYSYGLEGQTEKDNQSDNMIIHGDNLEALKALLPKYEGRIKCIYIDPPYNTGNEGWVYNDNVNDPRIKKWLGEVVGKEGEDLSRHDKWLCMMYPRLKLLQKLLAEDGALFISIDGSENANLKIICDEIFGSANYVDTISWFKKASPSNDAQFFSNDVEFILVYAKKKSIWKPNRLPLNEKQRKYYQNPDNDERGAWNSATYTCNKSNVERPNLYYPIINPNTGEAVYPKQTAVWKYSKEQTEIYQAEGKLYWGNDGNAKYPRFKKFLSEHAGVVNRTFWHYDDVSHTQGASNELKELDINGFATPKPTRLIERIIQIASEKDCIILDSFSGSGTTAHAVLNMNKADGGNRKFILIEMMEYADYITAERVKRVIRGYGDEKKKIEGTGGDFSFYELGERLLLENGNLNPNIEVEKIREYIWYMETKKRYVCKESNDTPYFLSVYNNTAYYCYYEKNKVMTVDNDFLAMIKTKANAYVVYADLCTISENMLQKYNITFKKIPKAVVWLVPSDAILNQTVSSLQNVDHPYRRKMNTDFGGKVEVYTKEQLLNGQNFNPGSVNEYLSVFVLSYDSFRTSKKDGRKAYQENGYLESFTEYKTDSSLLLEGTDETALIQVIRKLNPVTIVDESHHAASKLSIEMLENFNPAFVLELTATPKESSNIISFVNAKQLKKEEMVKLPVIVYNRRTQDDVFASAISLRQKLENEAMHEEEATGRYIRPIVLFQAEPKNKNDSITYEKVKKALLEIGIPEEQIAVKTANKDDIRNQNLLSRECNIRYIITVNALKEGWDCPFAYILATIANRSSSVDVEQILERILRMPNAKANRSMALNLSYVITSSSDFFATCEKVVLGLNVAGFSKKDYRAKEDEYGDAENNRTDDRLETNLNIRDMIGSADKNIETGVEVERNIDVEILKGNLIKLTVDDKASETDEYEKVIYTELDQSTTLMVKEAEMQNMAYWEELNQQENDACEGIPESVVSKMGTYSIKTEFLEEALQLEIPQFVIETQPTLFSEHETALLEKENLYKGFTLKDKDTQIDFHAIDVEMAKVDIEDDKDGTPKAFQLKGYDNIHMKAWFDAQPSDKKRRICKDMICKKISRNNAINDAELDEYVNRIMNSMTEDQLTDLEQSYYPYMIAIEKKVNRLLSTHAFEYFEKLLEQERIMCRPVYHFPKTIVPPKTISSIPQSLYEEEEQFDNEYEKKLVWELSALDNIKWWHRNIVKRGFVINGAVHAYPDLIVMTKSGKMLVIETKGDQLKNDESKIKSEIGAKWAAKASMVGRLYKYYMVFQTKNPDYEGAYSYGRFMEIVKEL